ncbi:MAG: hypothetical protein EOQ52_14930 [Mesorhizobium sp.]|nr:hypothetical protein CK216_06705 [Mesorhizobium sp. WSM3876]RWB74206.1 MAG: hypothetical protein EOQ49_07135 [Mesorhizobium sp.]RWB88453.1 MAG: hypothetical protein EOQ52_14930 [Mesorhizobium sp.]RWE24612.1 MAG: hypothetical protein EOS41_15750 [Mesorhizobium sp.]TGT61481.1 hypothetical protein EN813_021475 [Mesorhizobium sp. M00.F.Ca.ET.170.01.1.1]
MRGDPAWQGRRSVQHLSIVSALRADPPSPIKGEGKSRYTSGFSATHSAPPIRPRKISQPTWLFDLNSLRH